MILALGDFEAGRIEPETIKQELIDHAAPSQPQYDRLTNLFRSGHLAYNGTDIPELTEKGHKLYAALDRGRDPAERPAVIPPASLPPIEWKDGRAVFFAEARRSERETDAAKKAPGNEQSEAAAALLREAEIAVAQMQEKGVGFNETALSRAVFEAHKAGLAPAEPERTPPAQPEREAPEPQPRRFSAFSDAERERGRDRADPSATAPASSATPDRSAEAERSAEEPRRFSAFSDMKRDSGRDQGESGGRAQRFGRDHDGGRDS
jgi:hypothetical protein